MTLITIEASLDGSERYYLSEDVVKQLFCSFVASVDAIETNVFAHAFRAWYGTMR
jgi:hypothetical protein